MPWIAARLLPQKQTLALYCLKLGGFETYLPRIREHRTVRGRRIDATPPLFPGYCFIGIGSQWHAARWSPGVASLIMHGASPARVPDATIAEIRAREVNGLVELPQPPKLKPGDRVRIIRGPLHTLEALYAGQCASDRILVLLALLGAERTIEMPAADIAPLR
jgi:transcription antitermination factor NusG